MSNNNDSLTALALNARSGDTKAFGLLIEATQNRLFRFCIALTGDGILSEDITQETFLKAFNGIKTLNKNEAIMDWLFKIAKNLHIDHVRSKANFSKPLDEAGLETVYAESADQNDLISVHRTLSQFEPEDRALLLLVDLEERTYGEAAAILGISEDAVRTRLFRLRKTFVEKYNKPETK